MTVLPPTHTEPMRLLISALLMLTLCPGASAAETSGPDAFFGLTNLWTLHLTLNRSDWAAMEPVEARPMPTRMDGPPGRGPGPGGPIDRDFPWRTCTFECAGQTLSNVAIRFKGNSSFNVSRAGLKRPLKLDFDRGAKGRGFFGLEQLSLNNNVNDATQFREVLAYDACRRAGLPASRTAFGKVFLTLTGERTNAYLGLYTLVEPVNKDFLRDRLGTARGLLLKPERLPSLEYLGEHWAAYTNPYDPKTDVTSVETDRFIGLTRLIAQADDTVLRRELPERIDLTNFLRYLAVTAVLANYDSFVGNGHNYYFFQPATDGRAVFIPWDLNEAFGGHPPAGPRAAQAEFSVLHPQAGPNRLIERVLAQPAWAAAYRHELSAVMTNACDTGRLKADAERLAQVAQAAVCAESPMAKALFQRVALGQTGIPLPEGARGRGGPGFGPRPGGGEDLSLAAWIELRGRNVLEELAGEREGTRPRRSRFPGGPGGPGAPDRPGPPE